VLRYAEIMPNILFEVVAVTKEAVEEKAVVVAVVVVVVVEVEETLESAKISLASHEKQVTKAPVRAHSTATVTRSDSASNGLPASL